MAISTSLLLLSCFLLSNVLSFVNAYSKENYYNTNKPYLNKIDSCWRAKPNWAMNRKALADCAIGFGKDSIGGKYGAIYIVTDSSDDPANPKPGTLRYGAIQMKPLWIIFERNMVITLKNELIMNSYKTIDGRGVKVEIGNGPCFTIQGVSHVIIHGISIHGCKPSKAGLVRSTPDHVGRRRGADGDAISIFASSNIWIDHCFLARSTDGLIDIIHASTAITISNNYFTQHDKVSLTTYVFLSWFNNLLINNYNICMH
jgi:pectate lyase